ncbi:aldo/keto reductase [uncultured Mailhella sp.]|uniref:aldo/keto reductase n=1 Tax=uncultured Mailhella sp. TaxID=1981031 RepID=UPI00260DFC91|nr:aldo/keto reductase [uncultured Mailhella sp.]
MNYVKLGRSDLTVSRICMGCMGFGDAATGQHRWTVDEEQTRGILRRALELGINFFDTAPVYQNGSSERFLGRALRDFARRDEYVLATKFTPRTQEEIDAGVSGQKHVENALNRSLENLGVDFVDLYICHMWDYHTPMEEIMEGLHSAVTTGKARCIGISNCFAWQLAKANFYAREHGLSEFVSVQGHYNLIAREEEREMVPFCRDQNIALTPYSPLAGGRLSRRPGESTRRFREDAYARFKYDATAEADGRIILRVAELAERRGVSMTEIALAWLLSKSAVPVVGATRVSHVEGAVRAAALELTPEEQGWLEELYVPHALAGVMAQNGKQKAGNVV